MNLLPNFKQIDLLSLLLLLTQLYRHRVSIFTKRYMLSNCPFTVECLSQQQGPALAKLCNNWNESPAPLSLVPTYINSIAQSSCQENPSISGWRDDLSWCIFILIIGLIFWFPVHHLIWPVTLWGKQWQSYFQKRYFWALIKWTIVYWVF